MLTHRNFRFFVVSFFVTRFSVTFGSRIASDLGGIGPTEALLPRPNMNTLLLHLCIYRGLLALQITPEQWAFYSVFEVTIIIFRKREDAIRLLKAYAEEKIKEEYIRVPNTR